MCRNSVKKRGGLLGLNTGLQLFFPLFRTFRRLDLVPQPFDFFRRQNAALVEYMRMPPDQLCGDRLHHVAKIE